MRRAPKADGISGEPRVGSLIYIGLFLITLATLMEEILLTRIFSVTMWYHYAFVAISIAMFGMTVGALLVYLRPGYFTPEKTRDQLALSALLFSVSIVVSFLTHLAIPFVTDRSLVGLYSVILTYTVISVPFVFSGICVCLALTRFPRHVSKLYAADLAGAAVGCALLVAVLKITDGPTAVIVTACIAAAGSASFALASGARRLRTALAVAAALAVFSAGHTVLVHRQLPLLRLIWVKERREERALYERWNSFSRIRVGGDVNKLKHPFGWGMGSAAPTDRWVHQVNMNIDATAATPLTEFNGDVSAHDYLRYDVTNVAHYLRPAADVLVVGPGGGRDILSALTFGQHSVLAVEMNGNIIDTVNGKFGDFTGHLDRDPRVKFVNDEARSYIARQTGKFDIIQISLIDTWAATAAGAFVLAENSLYTTDAWKVFLSRLTPRGVLTVSRWYFQDNPGEVYRLVSLATAALLDRGVTNPREHILVLRSVPRPVEGGGQPDGVGTILVSPSPFAPGDVEIAHQVARGAGFEMVLSPDFALDSTFETIASGRGLMQFTSHFPIDITPPTDNRPFFFHMLRFRDIFNPQRRMQGVETFNMQAVSVLGVLLAVVLVLTALCVVVPLIRMSDRRTLQGAGPLLVFFASIGLGFMFVEISQMQRLIVFLGHPTYGLTVVLFSLLLSSGLGSYTTQRSGRGVTKSALVRLAVLLCGLIAFGVTVPRLMAGFQSSGTPLRILLSVAVLFPLGLLMGMPFPLGMKLASARSGALTPWLWGVNGATSVCASVVAVAVAMSAGISASFWTGFACYGVALAAFVLAGRRGRPEPAEERAPERAPARRRVPTG